MTDRVVDPKRSSRPLAELQQEESMVQDEGNPERERGSHAAELEFRFDPHAPEAQEAYAVAVDVLKRKVRAQAARMMSAGDKAREVAEYSAFDRVVSEMFRGVALEDEAAQVLGTRAGYLLEQFALLASEGVWALAIEQVRDAPEGERLHSAAEQIERTLSRITSTAPGASEA